MVTRILLAGVLAAGLAMAQRGGGGGDLAPRGDFGVNPLDRIGDQLKLSKDQKRDIKTILDDAQKAAAPLHEVAVKAHGAVGEAVAAGKSKEEIAKAVQAAGELDVQVADVELHAFAKIAPLLEPAQKQQGLQLFFVFLKGAFNGKNWSDPRGR